MAAPDITVNFTADVQSGAPPFSVQFTNTTIIADGFERFFLWEFGDGTISIEENPSHIYDGAPGQGFNVKLTVLATTGEFDALAFQDLNALAQVGGEETNGQDITEPLAFDAFLAASPVPFANAFVAFQISRTGGAIRQYKQGDVTVELRTNFDTGLHILVFNPVTFTSIQGTINVSPGGSVSVSDDTAKQEHSRVLGLTQASPINVNSNVTPIANLPDTTSTNQQHGVRASFDLRSYFLSSTQAFSDEEKLNFVVIGVPPISAFNASPTQGSNPLSVQLINQTTLAVGLPTTYSWRKRKTGSGDAFQEFSTAENPIEIFTK